MSASQSGLKWTTDTNVIALMIPPLGWGPFELGEFTIKKATNNGTEMLRPQIVRFGSLKDDPEIVHVNPVLSLYKEQYNKLYNKQSEERSEEQSSLEPVEHPVAPIGDVDLYDRYYQKPLKGPIGTLGTRLLLESQKGTKVADVTINENLSQTFEHEDILVEGWAILFKRDPTRVDFLSLNKKFGEGISGYRDVVLSKAEIREKVRANDKQEKERLAAQSETS